MWGFAKSEACYSKISVDFTNYLILVVIVVSTFIPHDTITVITVITVIVIVVKLIVVVIK